MSESHPSEPVPGSLEFTRRDDLRTGQGQGQHGQTTRVSPRASFVAGPDPGDLDYYLVVVSGSGSSHWVRLASATMTVGRDSACDIVLADPELSREHLRVTVNADGVVLEDRQSTNGTFVDGCQVSRAELREGSLVQAGSHVLRLERRHRREVERAETLARDLEKASNYVKSLLPPRLTEGPVRTDWSFQPSEQLGGDVFGYGHVDADTFVIYLIDVSGHGVEAAMHSVSVLNVVRQQAVPGASMRAPAQVLAGLSDMFQMDQHDGMFFTMWYGVYDLPTRTLRYGCAGHHPGYLVPPDRSAAQPLRTAGLVGGAFRGVAYDADSTLVPAGSSLYVFSDGVFEIETRDQQRWRLGDFVPVILAASDESFTEAQRIHRAVQAAARPGPLEDDFSLLVLTFP